MRILPLAFAFLLITAGPAMAAPVPSYTVVPDPPFEDAAATFTSTSSSITQIDPTLPPVPVPITSVEWDFDDDGEFDDGSGGTVSYTYTSDGPKKLNMRVTDLAGAVGEASFNFRVADPPPPPPPPNRDPVARFTFAPSSPIVDQEVLFEGDDSSDPDGSIVKYEWDLDGGTAFDDGTGDKVSKRFQVAGEKTVKLRVTDNDGATNVRTRTFSVAAPPPNKLPVVQFSITPSSPAVGDQVTLKSFSYDPDGSIKELRWDLDGDGDFSENVGGATAFTTFLTAGPRIVRLRVTDNEGGVQTDTVEITVNAAPAAPPASPPTTPPTTSPKARLIPLGSRALVRLAGSATMVFTRVTVLQVRAPSRSLIEVRCSGKSCPVKRVRKRVKNKPLRFDALERSLRAGTVLTVYIRKTGYIGKFTQFVMRPGKAPKRIDACVMPSRTKRSRCPAV